jgi:hypothetical protein
MSTSEIRRLITLLEASSISDQDKMARTIISKTIDDKFRIKGSWSINDGKVDVKGSVQTNDKMAQFPFSFGQVSDHFNCQNTNLKTLVGGPIYVGGEFLCSQNLIITLVGAPIEITGAFTCYGHRLTSLEGLPSKVGICYYLSWLPKLPLLRLVGKKCSWIDNEGWSILQKNQNEAMNILNKYENNASRANILACQKELINAGFEDNASW